MMDWKDKGTRIGLLLTALAIGMLWTVEPAMTEARRMHEKGETSVSETSVVDREPLSVRIQKILHPEPVVTPTFYTLVPYSTSNDILGHPMATEEQCVRYLLSVNPNPNISVSPEMLVAYYYEEGFREGIRPDVAFAQALKETGFFRYGGTVTPDQNNYCGLGTTSTQVKGAYFPNARLGVRAHIQHLKAYASTQKPTEVIVDPRYELVRNHYGEQTLNKWEDLNGRWAVPGDSYGQSILQMFSTIVKQ